MQDCMRGFNMRNCYYYSLHNKGLCDQRHVIKMEEDLYNYCMELMDFDNEIDREKRADVADDVARELSERILESRQLKAAADLLIDDWSG